MAAETGRSGPSSPSPLRHHGVYSFQGRHYIALHLATHGDAWGSTALVCHPMHEPPFSMLYLRHADHLILDYRDWSAVGQLADLVDLRQDDPLEDSL